MRILHTSDWHLGKSIEGRSRLKEQKEFLEDFVCIAREEQADLVIIAGDVYDSVNPPAEAEKLFYHTLKQVTEGGKRLVLVIAGNHDSPDRLVAAGPLAMEHGILMAGLPKTVIPEGAYGKHRVTASGEGYVELEIGGERAVILLLPYPSEKRLGEVLYQEMEEGQERAGSYGERVGLFFSRLEEHYREDTINLAVSHLFAMDAQAGGSERGIELGGSYLVDGGLLPKKAQYIALGHVHKPQAVPHTEGRAFYSGGPMAYHRSEAGGTRQCILVEVHPGQSFVKKDIPLPVYKPIRIWHAENVEEAISLCEAYKDEESFVYLEIRTDQGYIRENEIRKMKALKSDILEIRPIPAEAAEIPELEERLEEKSLKELFIQYYRRENKGALPDQELTALLLELAGEADGKDESL